MRQRRIKGLEEKLKVYNGGIQVDPRILKGRWQDIFESEKPLYLELGCGKGQFASSISDAYQDRNILAVEGNRSAMLRALQKAARRYGGYDPAAQKGVSRTPSLEEVVPEGIFAVKAEEKGIPTGFLSESPYETSKDDCVFSVRPNLAFACLYIRSVEDCFREGELDGIYLNFSDPWPKDRQESRRLTHRGYLEGYRKVIRPGGALEFKTDNEGLFRFSMEEFRASGLIIDEYTEDLHGEGAAYRSADFMTEYEQKFSSEGKPIYYCRVIFPE